MNVFFVMKSIVDFMLNLILLLGKFYIHNKCKWSKRIPNIYHFKADMKIILKH